MINIDNLYILNSSFENELLFTSNQSNSNLNDVIILTVTYHKKTPNLIFGYNKKRLTVKFIF